MIRVQFSLRTVFVVMTACCLLLAWWAPAHDDVRFAGLYFQQWRPSIAALRVTTAKDFYHLLGCDSDPKADWFDWPDFSTSDVIPIPLNGLVGEPTAEYRIEAFEKPVHVDFRGTPLPEAVEALKKQCGTEIQCDLRQFAQDGADSQMPITFRADGIPLRDVLHSMLEPRDLTFLVRSEMVLITTQRSAQNVDGPSPLDRKDWYDYCHPELRHRLRMHGKLVFITSFAGAVETDGRAVGYTIPKGAKVMFMTDRMATVVDLGYTLAVVSFAVVLIVWFHAGGGVGMKRGRVRTDERRPP